MDEDSDVVVEDDPDIPLVDVSDTISIVDDSIDNGSLVEDIVAEGVNVSLTVDDSEDGLIEDDSVVEEGSVVGSIADEV